MSARGGILSFQRAGDYTAWILPHGAAPTGYRVYIKGLTGSGGTIVLEKTATPEATSIVNVASYTTDQNGGVAVTENDNKTRYRLRCTVAPAAGRVIDARLLTDALFFAPA